MYTKWEVFEDKDIIITDIGMFSAAERRGKCAIMYCIFNCLLTGKISRIVAQNAAPQPDTAGPSIVQPYIPSVMEPSVAVSSIAEPLPQSHALQTVILTKNMEVMLNVGK